jgi:hypothetical protein
MILSPLLRLARRLPLPSSISTSPTPLILAATAALQRLDLSRDPRKTLHKLRSHKFTVTNTIPLLFMASCAMFSLIIMSAPIAFRLFLPTIYILALLLPITSQFVYPATPVFAWLITFFCARFIPSQHRPTIHVALLPALESVLYGANISDLQTRYTNAFLDVLAWLPYGVLHFALPFVVALVLWIFGPRGAVQYWGRAFGFMNLLGVITQLIFPCAAPCKCTSCDRPTDPQGMKSSTVSPRPTTRCPAPQAVCSVSTASSTRPATPTRLEAPRSSLAPFPRSTRAAQ